MNIHKLLQRGTNHDNFCEDYCFVTQKDNFLIAAVLDGCSSGEDSYFASSFVGKIMEKNVDKIFNRIENTADKLELEIIRQFIKYVVYEVCNLIDSNNFKTKDMLTTIIMLVTDTNTQNGVILALGDGCISVNGQDFIIEQDNKPDYIAYYLQSLKSEKYFDKWFNNQKNIIYFEQIKDITIATDGILSFVKSNYMQTEMKHEDIFNFFTKNTDLYKNKIMLKRKYNILKNLHFFETTDDLSIIRIINV